MSKYYKAEDVIRKRAEDLADTSYWEYGNPKNVDDWIEVAEMEFKDLPTLEVSDEVLKATKNFNTYTIVDENAEMGMRTQIEPIIEVSEDCISREWVLQMLTTYEKDSYSANELDEWQNRVVEWIEMDIKDAPSVVSTCQKNRQVERAEGEWELVSDNDGEYGICSICGNDADFTHYGKSYNYCPNCGARMKG